MSYCGLILPNKLSELRTIPHSVYEHIFINLSVYLHSRDCIVRAIAIPNL